ncbi:hypothetical protein LOTGIDRAFT_171402 [Lottia gigantea]|uniref:Uncharacterized protein n=1 Tax=Lottia gigantea TaxID=225164 RepID=V4CMB8_LOTGI|nr:hypothetical protein LOTGIDRAFT_171402 [Lottia gigantea]ESP03465.1 hypothetical protein LOTGIDRAFT_171402 [Lottia gigantea]
MSAGNRNSYKNPPYFGPDTVYDTWKNELEIWRRVTDLDADKQALAITLSLTGRARERAVQIPADYLDSERGIDILIAKLDDIFKKETKDATYEAYLSFENFRKTDDMSIETYVIEFERLNTRLVRYGIELPDAVLAFKLLDNACLSTQGRQMSLTAAADLTYSDMKSALKRIFGAKIPDVLTSSVKLEVNATASSRRFTRGKYQTSESRNDQTLEDPVKGTNPLNRFGKRSRCAICQSTYHWAKDCQHKKESVNIAMNKDEDIDDWCNITLLVDNKQKSQLQFVFDEEQLDILVVESSGAGVLDTACTKTVCGCQWYNDYLSRLHPNLVKLIQTFPSDRTFRFGDGVSVRSLKMVKIPIVMGRQRCMLEVEVVDTNIPLLLSRSSLKKADAILDLKNDSATMFGHNVRLDFTASGHYCVDLLPCVNDEQFHDVLFNFDELTTKEKQKTLIKLHRQFGHASYDRLHKLLVASGIYDKKLFGVLERMIADCEICLQRKKPPNKPTVSLPLAANRTVAEHLSTLHKARTEFTRAECSDRIRRALKSNVRTFNDTVFNSGDKVFYKRPDSDKWKGPGIVIGIDSSVVFVRHGGSCVRVHKSRVIKQHENDTVSNDQNIDTEDDVTVDKKLDNDLESENETSSDNQDNDDHHAVHNDNHQSLKLKAGMLMSFNEKGSQVTKKVRIMSRAGKATGKHKDWYNTEILEPVELIGEKLPLICVTDKKSLYDAIHSTKHVFEKRLRLEISELIGEKLPLICVTDKKSLYDAIHSTKHVFEKRLRLEISGIKEMIDNYVVKEIIWSETSKQLADCLTKKGASSLLLLKTLEQGHLDL